MKRERKLEKIMHGLTRCLMILVMFVSMSSNAYGVPPEDIDWNWPNPAPDFPNEAYGPRTDVNPDEIGDNHLFDVWVPDGEGSFPVMIYAHGGGFGTYDKTVAINGQHNLINDGIVFISLNYTLDQGPTVAINDIIDAIQYIIDNSANYKIDPNKVFLCGNSAGGIAMNFITFDDKRFNANNIKGVWHGNYHESQHNWASLQVANLSAVGIPIGVGMNRVYPDDEGHSALKGQEIAERSYAAGNTGLFTGDGGNQVWYNGEWILYPQQGINTGAPYPTQAEWINSIANGGDVVDPVLTSITETETQSNFNVYPNPAGYSNYINIVSDNKIEKVDIYNISGKLVQSTIDRNNQINISNLQQGIYIIKVKESNGNVQQRKLIVNK